MKADLLALIVIVIAYMIVVIGCFVLISRRIHKVEDSVDEIIEWARAMSGSIEEGQ